MIEIITPVSHLLKDEQFKKVLYKKTDYLEAREHTENLTYNIKNKIKLFHFDTDINFKWDSILKKKIINLIQNKKKLKFITFSIGKNCERAIIKNYYYVPKSRSLKADEMSKNIKENIKWLKKKFKFIKIGIENTNYYKTRAYEIVTDPNFISKIVNENDIFFLLDIAHAKISSINYNMKFEEYLNKLPMHKVIQLHICRPLINGKIAIDKHYLPSKKNLVEVKEICSNYPSIKYLTVEYYRNKKKLIDCLIKCKAIKSKF